LFAAIGEHERVGMGFSAYGEPEDADLVVFWRDPEGHVHFKVSQQLCTYRGVQK
jgi:hypothetical protein